MLTFWAPDEERLSFCLEPYTSYDHVPTPKLALSRTRNNPQCLRCDDAHHDHMISLYIRIRIVPYYLANCRGIDQLHFIT